MKKSLSLILCLAMLLSLGTLAISAADDDTAGYVLYANYGDVAIDGVKDDSMHLGLNAQNKMMDGSTTSLDWNVAVGAVWNAGSLYLGFGSGAANTHRYQGKYMDLVYVSVTNESGYRGSIERGVPSAGTKAACLANTTTYTTTTMYGTSETTTPGYVFAEFEIPMEQLSFYAREDGSIATKVHVYVDDYAGAYETDTDITVILSDYSVLAARDAHGATSNVVAAFNDALDAKANSKFSISSTSDQGGNLDRGYWSVSASRTPEGAFTVKPVRTAEGVLKAGVASLLNVDLVFDNYFGSTAGPVEAENWGKLSDSDPTDNWSLLIDADTSNGSNPARLVLTTKLNENGANGAALLGYAIYRVNNEFRLYSAEATSAGDDYVVLKGAVQGLTGSENHAATNHDLRLEIGTDYKTVVTMDGKYMGTLAKPAVTAYDAVALKDGAPSELTVVATGDASTPVYVTVKNGLVGEKNAEATEILNAMIPKVYGHQDTRVADAEGNYSVRFLADVSKALDTYAQIGFDLVVTEGDKTSDPYTYEVNKVYESVQNDEGTHDGYLAVFALRNLKVANGPTTITVTPWVVTTYGEAKMYGAAYTVTYTANADGVLSHE